MRDSSDGTATPGAPRADAAALPNDQDATGRSFGPEELDALADVLRSGTLTSTKGSWVRAAEERFGALLGADHVIATSSGTSAVHAAVACVDPEPGEEIVTTAITDMGALTPILYQGAVPVFADVDPRTGNVTADTVAAVLSERTRAIIVTHLFGAPADLAALRALADARGVVLIEDCAQAFLARAGEHMVGTVGDLAAFSLQQGKHVTAGEGGFVVAGDPARAARVRRWVNKAWEYGAAETDHDFLALNSRLGELQGAVARVQLDRLEESVARRRRNAERLRGALAAVPGVGIEPEAPGDVHAYWRVPLMIDAEQLPGGPVRLAQCLRIDGVAAAPRYIQKPAFRCGLFREQRTFGQSRWPFTLARPEALDYRAERFPGTFAFLDAVLVLPWNERMEDEHVDHIAAAVARAAAEVAGAGARGPA